MGEHRSPWCCTLQLIALRAQSTRRRKKLRLRCIKGIPDSMRVFAWVRLADADAARKRHREWHCASFFVFRLSHACACSAEHLPDAVYAYAHCPITRTHVAHR